MDSEIDYIELNKSAQNQKDGSECCICLAEFIEDDEIIILKCNERHIFHDGCISGWVT